MKRLRNFNCPLMVDSVSSADTLRVSCGWCGRRWYISSYSLPYSCLRSSAVPPRSRAASAFSTSYCSRICSGERCESATTSAPHPSGGGHTHRRAARDSADSREIRSKYLLLAIVPCHVRSAARARFEPRLRIRGEALSGAGHLFEIACRMAQSFASDDTIGIEE